METSREEAREVEEPTLAGINFYGIENEIPIHFSYKKYGGGSRTSST